LNNAKFLDEPESFYRCPGRESLGKKRNPLFPEFMENMPLPERKLFFFSTTLERIYIF